MPTKRTFCQREIRRDWRRRERDGHPPPEIDHWRPKTRGDCKGLPRPCVYVGCRHHLFLEVTTRGGLRVPHGMNPDTLWKMQDTCSLDVAERGGQTLQAVAQLHVLTRERVRQIELNAMEKMKAWAEQEEAHMGGSSQPPSTPRETSVWDLKKEPGGQQADGPLGAPPGGRLAPQATHAAGPSTRPLLTDDVEVRQDRLRRALGAVMSWAKETPPVAPPGGTPRSQPAPPSRSKSAASPRPEG